MSQFPHDQFAKDLLESLLSPFGKVETNRKISSEVREIDVCFFPNPVKANLPGLGLLQRLASTGAAFEPFRNPVSAEEIRSCMSKLFDLHSELSRQARREKRRKKSESLLPRLWILTPTLAAATLEDFGAIKDVGTYGEGVYLMSPGEKTGFVVIHQLPETPDTLWLRVLGKNKVQQRAMEEINRLDINSPYRQNTLQLFSALKVVLEAKQNRNNQEKESVMRLIESPVYLEYIERIKLQALTEGRNEGRNEGRAEALAESLEKERKLILKLLTRKVGNLSPELTAQVQELSIERLESLGEALLDFEGLGDLESWFC